MQYHSHNENYIILQLTVILTNRRTGGFLYYFEKFFHKLFHYFQQAYNKFHHGHWFEGLTTSLECWLFYWNKQLETYLYLQWMCIFRRNFRYLSIEISSIFRLNWNIFGDHFVTIWCIFYFNFMFMIWINSWRNENCVKYTIVNNKTKNSS